MGNCQSGSRKVYNLSLPKLDSDNYTIGVKIVKYSGSPVLRVSGQYTANTTV